MSRIERFQPGTKVSDWASGSIVANPGYSDPTSGYFGGGHDGSNLSRVDKFAFSDDSRSTLSTGMSVARYNMGSMASAVAGYFAAGQGGTDVVDKFAFSNDSRTTLSTGVSDSGMVELAGMASSTAGYLGGGTGNGGYLSHVDKFAFSNDGRTTLGTGLSVARRGHGGFASSTAGYFAGGFSVPSGAYYHTTVDKFAFSNDARSTLGTGLSAGRAWLAGMNSSSAGYISGGEEASANVSTVDKFAFSDDSRTTLGTGLSSARDWLGAMASAAAGYVAGGFGITDDVDKFDFDDDSRTTLATGLTTATGHLAGMSPLR